MTFEDFEKEFNRISAEWNNAVKIANNKGFNVKPNLCAGGSYIYSVVVSKTCTA